MKLESFISGKMGFIVWDAEILNMYIVRYSVSSIHIHKYVCMYIEMHLSMFFSRSDCPRSGKSILMQCII